MPDASDALITLGGSLVVLAVAALAGPWWAVLALGLKLIAAGIARTRAEG